LQTSKKPDVKCRYLIDTSALYPLVLSGKAFKLEQFAVSSLTQYELGNVLWKETKKRRIDYKLAAQTYSEVLSELTKINVDGISDVLSLALERNLSFYDASYAYISEKDGLKLVTEDTELLKKCKCAIGLKDLE
jgi:predicted nucleic acid-binding protein